MKSGKRANIHGIIVSYMALLVALGGTAIAAKPLITGADVQDDSLTGADILESSLGQVPSAANADTLGGAGPNQFAAAHQGAFALGPFPLNPTGTATRTFDVFTFEFTCHETNLLIRLDHAYIPQVARLGS